MAIEGTVPVTGPIAPTSELDIFASHEEQWGRGGYRTVANATERNAIPALRRKAGMLVRTEDDGNYWRLDPDLTTWHLAFDAGPEDLSQNGRIERPQNKTYVIVLKAPRAGTVDSLTYQCASGTATLAVRIDGTPVTGLTALSLTNVEATATASGANAFSAGQTVSIVVTNQVLCDDFDFTLAMTSA